MATSKSTKKALPKEAHREVMKALTVMRREFEKQLKVDVEARVKGAARLQREFDKVVKEEVEEQVAKERTRLARLIENNERLTKELTDFMKRQHRGTVHDVDMKSLRQFCHPDKHPGNEAKAQKAFTTVVSLLEQLT